MQSRIILFQVSSPKILLPFISVICSLQIRKKGEYTPFPPAQQPSKVDLELEKGTYFLAQAEQKRLKRESKVATSEETSKKRQVEKRSAAFVPPQSS